MKHQLTIRDLAKTLDLSIGTVSLALNDNPMISAKTKLRVHNTAQKLGYVPSMIGKAINRKKSGVVGTIVPVSTAKLFPSIVSAVNLRTEDYSKPIFVSYSQELGAVETHIIKLFAQLNIDGMIIALVPQSPNLDLLNQLSSHTPLVQVERYLPGLKADFVGSENKEAAYHYAKQLIQKGKKRIGIALFNEMYSSNDEHFQGYLQAVREFDLSQDPNLVLRIGSCAARSPALPAMYSAISDWLGQAEPPDGILWCSTYINLVAKVLHAKRLKNGNQIEIVVFDNEVDDDLQGQHFVHVIQDGTRIGLEAGRILVERVKSPPSEAYSSQVVRFPCLETELRDQIRRPISMD